MRKLLTILSAGALGAVVGFACNGESLSGGPIDPNDPGDGGTNGDMKGRIDSDIACGSVKAAATLMKAPVDVIFVIDNSGSMASEITAVQNNINSSFATIIKNSGIDYRIIMVSRHGLVNPDESICITAPLSGNATCSTAAPINPASPQNTANFFHYSVEIGSNDAFERILATYRLADTTARGGFNLAPQGWAAWLRANAKKTFIMITDDNATTNLPGGAAGTAANFDTALLALDPAQFGTAQNRNYIYHSISGVVENPAGATTPWPPTAAVQTTKCTGNGGDSVNPSQEHQRLSILTGGIRYPVCQYTNYDAVFQTVAAGVISGAKVACDFDVPAPPPMKEFKLDTAQLEFTPGNGGPARIFNQVADAAACTTDSFYIQNKHVYLCGTTCTDVQADSGAKIEFLLECSVIIG